MMGVVHTSAVEDVCREVGKGAELRKWLSDRHVMKCGHFRVAALAERPVCYHGIHLHPINLKYMCFWSEMFDNTFRKQFRRML